MCHFDINNKTYSLPYWSRNIFALLFPKTRGYECFPTKLSRRSRSPLSPRSEEKENSKASLATVHPVPLRPCRRWWHRCVECFYSITPTARRHPLNHLLNPRPSALSPPRLRLMAFENSNIIRRSILFPLRTKRRRGRRERVRLGDVGSSRGS